MKRKDIIMLLISFAVLTIAWIAFSIYHSSVTSTISDSLSIQISPITPTFDMQTIEKLQTRTKVSPLYQFQSLIPESLATESSQLNLPVTVDLNTKAASEPGQLQGPILGPAQQ